MVNISLHALASLVACSSSNGSHRQQLVWMWQCCWFRRPGSWARMHDGRGQVAVLHLGGVGCHGKRGNYQVLITSTPE